MTDRPAILASLDQFSAVLRDIAPVLANFRDELLEQDFTREEAMQLVAAVQEHLLRAARRRKRPDE